MAWQFFILPPLAGAFIGWLTNLLAVQLIFRPHRPWRLFFLPYYLQGLIPKYQQEIAHTVGEVVEQQLISFEDLWEHLGTQEVQGKLTDSLAGLLRAHLQQRLPFFMPVTLRDVLSQLLENALRREAPLLWQQVTDQWAAELGTNLRFAQIVEDKIMALDTRQMEALVLQVAAREFKHIEYLGAVLGLVIGLLQAGLFAFL